MHNRTSLAILLAVSMSVAGALGIYKIFPIQESQAQLIDIDVNSVPRVIGELARYTNRRVDGIEYRLLHPWVKGSLAVYVNGLRQEAGWDYLIHYSDQTLSFPHGTPASQKGSVTIIVDYEPK